MSKWFAGASFKGPCFRVPHEAHLLVRGSLTDFSKKVNPTNVRFSPPLDVAFKQRALDKKPTELWLSIRGPSMSEDMLHGCVIVFDGPHGAGI